MSTIESEDVDVESYPLTNMNSIVLRADGNDEDRHVQISVDLKSVRYLDEAELAHFGKRQPSCLGAVFRGQSFWFYYRHSNGYIVDIV